MSGIRGQRIGGQNALSPEIHRLQDAVQDPIATAAGRRAHPTWVPPGKASTVPARAPAGLSASSRPLWRKLLAEYEINSVAGDRTLDDGAALARHGRESSRDARRRGAHDDGQIRAAEGASRRDDSQRSASRVRQRAPRSRLSGSRVNGRASTSRSANGRAAAGRSGTSALSRRCVSRRAGNRAGRVSVRWDAGRRCGCISRRLAPGA